MSIFNFNVYTRNEMFRLFIQEAFMTTYYIQNIIIGDRECMGLWPKQEGKECLKITTMANKPGAFCVAGLFLGGLYVTTHLFLTGP